MRGFIQVAGVTRWFVVVVHDPVTSETDTYGPFDEWRALEDADRRRRELDAEELTDVLVLIVPIRGPDVPDQPNARQEPQE